MPKTFKSYLISWYCFVLSVTLVGFSIVLYLSISNYLESTIDQSLLTLANVEAIAAFELESRSDEPSEPHEHISPLDDSLQHKYGISDRFVTIFKDDGTLQSTYSTSKTMKMPSNTGLLKSLSGDDHVFETIYIRGEFLRIIYLPIVQRGTRTHIVQLGVITTHIVNIKQRLKITLFFLNLVILAVSLLTGYFLAKKAVRPIVTLSDTAITIDEEHLNKRLVVPASFSELERMVHVFNEMLERIESSFKARKQFIADASHEVRSPLAIMKGNMEIALRKKREPEEYVSALESNLEEAERLITLFESLLLLSQADDKRSVLRFSEISLCEFVKETVSLKEKEAMESKVALYYDDCELLKVTGDKVMIRQLLNNLIDNAIKYSPPLRKVVVSTGREGANCFLSVTDNGVGISEKDQEKVFDRFYRVDKSRSRETGGSGLGLSIVKDIARMHGGDISVESRTGSGSTFTFSWPAGNPEAPRELNERRVKNL